MEKEMNEYYIIVRATYVDFFEYARKQCKIKVTFKFKQINMHDAMIRILAKFYSEHENSDIITIDVIENKLY